MVGLQPKVGTTRCASLFFAFRYFRLCKHSGCPKAKTLPNTREGLLWVGGERGIRTPGPPEGGQRFSRPPHSTTLPSLQTRLWWSLVGAAGFEPATPCSQSRCASRAALCPDVSLFRLKELYLSLFMPIQGRKDSNNTPLHPTCPIYFLFPDKIKIKTVRNRASRTVSRIH